MNSIMISLQPLIDFATNDHTPRREGMRANTPLGQQFSPLVGAIADNIGQERGVYLLGRYTDSHYWDTIYIGKSINLRSGVNEMLSKQRPFFWCGNYTGLSKEEVTQFYLELWSDNLNTDQSIAHIDMVLRKTGSTHIILVYTPDCNDLNSIRDSLIEILRPSANQNQPVVRGFQNFDIASCVLKQIMMEIHKQRPV